MPDTPLTKTASDFAEDLLARLEREADELDSLYAQLHKTYCELEPEDVSLTPALRQRREAIAQELAELETQAKRLASMLENERRRTHREFLSPVAAGMPCQPEAYCWDHWEQWALADGVLPELATLGRSLIREAFQHHWPEPLEQECGWSDDGAAMIRLALEQPERAKIRWHYLLASDGDFYWAKD